MDSREERSCGGTPRTARISLVGSLGKPKGSSARFVHGGIRRGRENASSQCSNTKRYDAEVTHAILPGKARTTLSKRVPVPETDTGTRQNSPITSAEGVPPHKGGRSDQARATCRKVKEFGDLMTGEPVTEAPVNGGRNYNGPKVAKFLVGKVLTRTKGVTIWALSRREAR
ncbi:hypothetical protein KY285_008019 [Solanum tuberosum]|nr:hypothetical protein KY285_008019 [Solanum tuberosum]